MEKKEIVINYIYNQIKENVWKKGDKIDTEQKMSSTLNISRGTVREALSILTKKGIIEKKQGSGTFVSDVSSLIDKKYVVIVSTERYVIDLVGGIYRITIEKVKELAKEAGYTPVFHLVNDNNDLTDTLNINVNEIAGVLSVNAHNNKKIFKTIFEHKIPVVSFLNAESKTYSSVVTDHEDMFYKICELIKKYKLKDVVAITHDKTIFEKNTDVFIYYAIDSFFNENYNLIKVPFSFDLKTTPKVLRKAFNNLNRVPDAIVFLDDTIYKSALPIFPEFNNLLKQTKIITHSSGDIEFSKKYKICRVEFDLKQIAHAGFNLLQKHINKEFIEDYNVFIKPTVINEEVLKN